MTTPPPRSLQIFLLSATLFVAFAGFSIVIPALGDLALRFEASSLDMGIMIGSYALAQLLFAPLWGALSDRFGRKPVLVAGLLGFAASFLVMGLADSYAGLLAGRVLGGVLSASTLPTAQAFAADLVEPAERSAALGRLGAAMALGFVLGPILAAVLLPLGIRVPFFVSLVLALITTVAAAWLLVEPERSEELASTTEAPPGTAALLAHATVSPMAVWFWSVFLVMFGASSVFALVVYFVEEQLHGTAVHASMVFASFGASSALCQGVLLQPLIRVAGEPGAVRVGFVVGVLGFVLSFLATNVPVLCAACALIAAGMAIGRPTMAALASRQTPHGQGVTLGLQSAFGALGRVIGPVFAGLIYAWSPRAPFACAAVAYCLGLVYTARAGVDEPLL